MTWVFHLGSEVLTEWQKLTLLEREKPLYA